MNHAEQFVAVTESQLAALPFLPTDETETAPLLDLDAVLELIDADVPGITWAWSDSDRVFFIPLYLCPLLEGFEWPTL